MHKKVLNSRFTITKEKERIGGTATVYQAFDVENSNFVAVKIFNQKSMAPDLTKEAYQREMKSLNDLNSHPNIAKVIDFGEIEGSPFIVLEWLERTLLDVLQDNKIHSWSEYYQDYGRPVLQALSFAHRRDIIHRDVKPENILFTDKDELRLVDFGISKFKMLWGGGVTFADWRSPPYTPPEIESFDLVNTKDIYGFAALSIACLEGRNLDADENLLELLKEQDLEPSIYEVLSECLNKSPEDRLQSIDEVIDTLDRLIVEESSSLGVLNCYLKLTKNSTQQLEIYLNTNGKSSIESAVSMDLNEVCGVERIHDSDHYSFIAANFRYRVAIDNESKKYFSIIGVQKQESWLLEKFRENTYSPHVTYYIGTPPISSKVKEHTMVFLDGLSEYESNAFSRNKEFRERKLINTWKAQLRLQFDLEQLAKKRIDYDGFRVVNGLIEFKVDPGEWLDTVGQERIIQGTKKEITITIEGGSNPDKIIGYLGNFDESDIPNKGSLVLDTSLQAIARKRQESALDDVIFDRACRADLKGLLFDPKIARPPNNKLCADYFQEGLDTSKKEAISAALGTEDFLVINGPPGTGKTLLITEIVLQFLKEHPQSRILISSQTHNAVDNALEKIRSVKNNDETLKAVRIARKDDERVSNKVKDLMLGGLVDTWLEKINEKSSKYLEQWANDNNVDKSEVELGLSVKILRERLVSYMDLVEKRAESLEDQRELSILIIEAKKEQSLPDELELLEFNKNQVEIKLREIEADLVSARRLHRKAQREVSTSFPVEGPTLCELSMRELEEWEDEFLSGSTEKEKCKDILELLQDWYDRFGKSRDFHAAYLSGSSIVASTCSGIALKSYKNLSFDLCIIDEASKASPTETLLPMVKSKRWIVVGDPIQLPPFVQQGSDNKDLLSKHNLTKEDLKSTLLDLLVENLPSESVKSLDIQYRMCPEIGKLISHCFYKKQLTTGRGNALPLTLAIKSPVTWYCTSKLPNRYETPVGNSFVNHKESDYIEKVLARLNLAVSTNKKKITICLLSFYSAQVNALKGIKAKVEYKYENLSIICDTVDSFQGREADVCIVSITRCNARNQFGFINDLNRVNVALSRGKEALIIVGDSNFCYQSGSDSPFERVINHINEHQDECSLTEIER